jgi:hypothetical protein
LRLGDAEDGWDRADERLEAMDILYVQARALRRIFESKEGGNKSTELREMEFAVEGVVAAILSVVINILQK